MDLTALTIKPNTSMFKKLLRFRAAFILLGSMLLTVMGYSQGVTTSSISGVVTDDNGAPLPGATVVAVHTPSGTRYGITTNAAGRYNFPAVRIGGPYDITISFVGYQEAKRQLLSADLGVPASLNIRLAEEGKQLSEVVVTARGSIIDAERNGASTNFKRETFERLPTLTRSFQDFSQLTPQAGPGFSFGGRSNLYNNFSIDGATSNNVFGLSALPGGQSNAQPVSVDAIQEISVQLSPYDVSQGAFTGAGVNAVTRSGTNKLQGSAYYFTKSDQLTGKKIEGTELPQLQRPSFSYVNYGARLGGAIIKNKLFFFGNFEREEATSPGVLYPYGQSTGSTVNQPGSAAGGAETDLERLRNFLVNTGPNKTWTYDPGTYNNFDVPQQSTKFLAKIDWNISDNHKLTVRYNQLNAFRDVAPSGSGGFRAGPTGGRSNSVNTLPFSNSYYRILNNLYSIFGELNSSFGQGKFANNLQAGYNVFRDTRQQGGGGAVAQFPTVDILGPNGQNLTSFGPDPFTPNNRLDQDVIQINDKFDAFLGDHTVTVGTANEFYHFYNVFTQVVNGVYQYNSISDFINNVTSPSAATLTTGSNSPSLFYQQYSAIAGNPAPAADFRASQLGFYAQDAYAGIKNLRLTLGVRVDIPIYNQSGLLRNEAVEGMKFANQESLRVDQLPVTTPLWSPRVGFNWNVLGDKSLQVRGGAGIFTGRVPFVWISNQLSNNGVFFNTRVATPTTATNPASTTGGPSLTSTGNTPFSPDINAYIPTSLSTASSFAINVTSPNFKFPQVFRTNIGIDKTLPGGFVLTGEAIYTKDVNAVYIRDANLAAPVGALAGDGRPLYGTNLLINPTVTQALVQDNTNQGYALSLTAQLQKTTGKLQGSIAYTYTDSKDLNAQGGSTAGSLYTGNPYLTDINAPVLGYASNWFPNRVVGNVNYRFDYAKNFATTLSLIYEGRNGGNFTYVYGGAPNGLTSAANTNLIYVPRNQSEILLTTTNATDTRTPQQIWDQLNAYIEQDPYLKTRRGQYTERGAALTPWVDFLNFRLLQDFKLQTGQNVNTLQLSFEMFNVLNFFNSNLGVVKSATRSSLLGFSGYETANTATGTTGRPIYTFATNADNTPLSTSYSNSQGVSNGVTTSRWQAQLGVRYIFN